MATKRAAGSKPAASAKKAAGEEVGASRRRLRPRRRLRAKKAARQEGSRQEGPGQEVGAPRRPRQEGARQEGPGEEGGAREEGSGEEVGSSQEGSGQEDGPAKKAPAKKSAPAKRTVTRAEAAKTATSKPTGRQLTESPFDAKFLEAQRAALLDERAILAGQAESLKAEADALARDREPGDVQFDDESGEGDTLAVERDFDLARAASALATIEEIDAALGRIDSGIYGICEYSGQAIPKERLKAIPYARERVEFKTRSFR